ncbi:MAG: acetoin utilization protein AcuC [Alphaproteobacteria bacterium]
MDARGGNGKSETTEPSPPAAAGPGPLKRPLFIGSEIYRQSSYGPRHPLAIPRVSSTIDLCRALGWLPDEAYLDSPLAEPGQLARFHDEDYIAAVIAAEAAQEASPEVQRRYNLGRIDNPIFPEMFRRPATASGAALLAARLLAEGGVVYSPAGGTHHGRPGRASGFCYFNDPVLAILGLLDQGVAPIYYVDVDAHHGDGVQDAFADDERVMTLSIHEHGRWPFSGALDDRAGGMARNLPVPRGFNDSELRFLVDTVVVPLGERLRPAAVVLQCGADGLEDDPMSKLSLSNRALWYAVAQVAGLAPRCLTLGGGGYNPWSVARCWAGVWAVLNHVPVPERLPGQAEAVLRALSWHRQAGRNPPAHWTTTLADLPRNGPIRDEIRHIAAASLL